MIDYVESSDTAAWQGFSYAGTLFMLNVFRILIVQQSYYGRFVTGMRVRSALTAAIYRKVWPKQCHITWYTKLLTKLTGSVTLLDAPVSYLLDLFSRGLAVTPSLPRSTKRLRRRRDRQSDVGGCSKGFWCRVLLTRDVGFSRQHRRYRRTIINKQNWSNFQTRTLHPKFYF